MSDCSPGIFSFQFFHNFFHLLPRVPRGNFCFSQMTSYRVHHKISSLRHKMQIVKFRKNKIQKRLTSGL